MATLQLDRVWLNLMSTGDALSAYSNGRTRNMAVDGEVRTYGGGRRRSVTAVGRGNSMAFTLVNLQVLEMVTLENWLGLEVMYRDFRGQRFVGAYFSLEYREHKDPGRWDIGLTLNEVSWAEGVV